MARREIIPLTDGGSDRDFYRVTLQDNKTFIYMRYGNEKEENRFYCDIAGFLRKLGVNVPRIYYKEDGHILLEDLGDTHLCNNLHVDYYRKVIDQLAILHGAGDLVYRKKPFRISDGFNYSLYRWESKYFLDNFGIKTDLEDDFHRLAEVLSNEKNVLIHRDCQSKNIIIKSGSPYFIDFQGMRYGLAEYDLASLLEDPYVNLPKDMEEELLDYYFSGNVRSRNERGRSSLIYNYCAIQRLLQALGAYRYLGIKKKKKEFLKYIPNGLKRLMVFLERQDELKGLRKLVASIMPSAHADGFLPAQKQ